MSFHDYLLGYATYKSLTSHAIAPNPSNASPGEVERLWSSLRDTTVFVWEPAKKGVGHTSLMIGNAPLDHGPEEVTRYASWWPGPGVNFSDKGDVFSDVPKAASTFMTDCRSEASQGGTARLPEHCITIPNLDVPAMQAGWNEIRSHAATYNGVNNNCSTIVARVLRTGLSTVAKVTNAYWSHCVYWTPTDVKKLAYAIFRESAPERILR